MRIDFKQKGDFSKLSQYLTGLKKNTLDSVLERYGNEGVAALASATPVDSGLTANSWYYEIEKSGNRTTIHFCNSNIQNGVPIAIVLQYGHATRNGGWVAGRDYINPAIQPIFDKMADSAWKEVTRT